MINIFIFIMIFMKESKGEWKQVWNEEFQNPTLDYEKWEVENELTPCHGNYNEQLNCYINSTRNLRLINGTLAITAIHEKYLDKDYTSGKITTKEGFTYGRFEIRAALPNAKMLRPSILMSPVKSSVWPKMGQIDIMTNVQTLKLVSGLHFNTPAVYQTYNSEHFNANSSLNDFHTYSIEWNEYEFKWFFDDINYLTININRILGFIYKKNGEPFHSPFKLLINLGVGGGDFLKQILTVEDVMDWKCSLLIIDYVRIYKWINGTEKHDSKDDRVSTDNICSEVMPLIRPKEKGKNFSLSITAIAVIISVISSSLLIVLIIIIVFLFIRKKKLKQMNVENNCKKVGDIDNEEFDAFNTSSQYANPYEEINDEYFECHQTERSYKNTDPKQNTNPQPIYLEIFNETKRLDLKVNVNSKPIYLEINDEM